MGLGSKSASSCGHPIELRACGYANPKISPHDRLLCTGEISYFKSLVRFYRKRFDLGCRVRRITFNIDGVIWSQHSDRDNPLTRLNTFT